jgi:heterodisulfide reductase subunit D
MVKRNLDAGAGWSDTFAKRMYQCLLCGNCSQNCPAGVVTEDIVEKMREQCVGQLGAPQLMEMTANNIAGAGSITGDARENRLLWFENMDAGSVKVGEKAEYLYFPGCVSALYPSSYSIPQSFCKLLNSAGLDWAVLGEGESCCTYPLVIGGMMESAVGLIEQNIRDVSESGAKCLVTTCPSCYHMWKHVYPKVVPVMPDIDIRHGAQLLAELVRANAFRFKETSCTVAYHDPCDLGRKSGVFDEPREILRAVPGVNLVEMAFHHENAFCCGGGGNLEMNDQALSGKVAQQRVGQALAVKADIIVTSCQQCKRTLTGGARQMRARIKVMDLSEFLISAI